MVRLEINRTKVLIDILVYGSMVVIGLGVTSWMVYGLLDLMQSEDESHRLLSIASYSLCGLISLVLALKLLPYLPVSYNLLDTVFEFDCTQIKISKNGWDYIIERPDIIALFDDPRCAITIAFLVNEEFYGLSIFHNFVRHPIESLRESFEELEYFANNDSQLEVLYQEHGFELEKVPKRFEKLIGKTDSH